MDLNSILDTAMDLLNYIDSSGDKQYFRFYDMKDINGEKFCKSSKWPCGGESLDVRKNGILSTDLYRGEGRIQSLRLANVEENCQKNFVGILNMEYYFRESNSTDTLNASYLDRFEDQSVWIEIVKNSGTLFGYHSQEDELRVNDSECLCVRDKWEF